MISGLWTLSISRCKRRCSVLFPRNAIVSPASQPSRKPTKHRLLCLLQSSMSSTLSQRALSLSLGFCILQEAESPFHIANSCHESWSFPLCWWRCFAYFPQTFTRNLFQNCKNVLSYISWHVGEPTLAPLLALGYVPCIWSIRTFFSLRLMTPPLQFCFLMQNKVELGADVGKWTNDVLSEEITFTITFTITMTTKESVFGCSVVAKLSWGKIKPWSRDRIIFLHVPKCGWWCMAHTKFMLDAIICSFWIIFSTIPQSPW